MTNPPITSLMRGCWRTAAGAYADIAATTPSVDGGHVRRLNSQGDNGIWIGNADALVSPDLNDNATPSGEGSLLFAANDWLRFSKLFHSPQTTIYVVARLSGSGVKTILCGAENSLQYRFDSGVQRLVSATVADIGLGDATQPENTWFQANVSWDLANGIFRVNGDPDGDVSNANKGYAGFRDIGLNKAALDTEPFVGEIAFLGLYSDIHTLGQRQDMESWITDEFGV